MNVTLGEAIYIYAGAMRAWFGAQAGAEYRIKSDAVLRAGEHHDANVWGCVAETAKD